MSTMPWIKWFPGDWIRDTRALSPAAKGAWIDILSTLHHSKPRGEATNSIDQWARIIGSDPVQTEALLAELASAGVAEMKTPSNKNVTVISRRMSREDHQRELLRQRVERHRDKKRGITRITPEQHDGNSQCNGEVADRCQKPEARSQNKTSGKPAVLDPEIPTLLKTETFEKTWVDWNAYRKERGLPKLKPKSLEAQFAQFVEWGVDQSVAAIRESIRQNWQGIFKPKPTLGSRPPENIRLGDNLR